MQYVILCVGMAAMFWSGFAFGTWVARLREKPTQTCSCQTTNRIAHIPLRIVFYRGIVSHRRRRTMDWTAHCLEFDIADSGETREDALERLTETIAIQLDYYLQQKDPSILSLFSPASEELFKMFARGKDVVVDNLEICSGKLADVADVADVIVVREYSAESFFDQELVPVRSP